MKTKLNIVIFDGSLKTTPFINRLAAGLAERHEVTILGFSNAIHNPLPKVKYVSLGSSTKPLHLMGRSIAIGLKYLFLKGAIGPWIRTKIKLLFFDKQQLKVQNFKASIALIQPDILHVQWPSLLPWLEHIAMDKVNVVLSQRGYQNNVRPFLDASNFTYLQTIYPKVRGFHSVSTAMSEKGDLIYNSSNKINRIVYSGFNFEQLTYETNYHKANDLEIISVGRPHWKKGFNYAIGACRILVQNGISFTYTIVGGEGDEELMFLIDSFNLKDRVILMPKVSQDEVYRMMGNSQVFVLPSVEEGLPNVLVEAMAIGVPVIATDCGGVKELVQEDLGQLVRTRDATALAQAIIHFSETPLAVINKQRERARAKVEEQHNVQKMIIDMEALYLKCMESVS